MTSFKPSPCSRLVDQKKASLLIILMIFLYRYLNGLGPMQIGGIQDMPLKYPPSNAIVYKFFDGCIREVKENLEMYDMAYPLKNVNAPAGCKVMADCPKCLNGGYCVPGFARSVCSCPSGYVGDDCSGSM